MLRRPKPVKKATLVKKNVTGRQLARVSAIHYRETVWSELYPGNRHTIECFQPAVLAAETALALSESQRKRTVWRMDGGSGSDEQFKWLLARGYQVLGKGFSNRRAEALAKQVKRWDPYETDAWLAEIASPVDFGRPVRLFIKRRLKDGEFCYSYYVSTLSLPAKGLFLQGYAARGGAEVEQFRNDKSGLALEARRKRSFTGQSAYILLTDLAHNLLADFHHKALLNSRFDGFGPKRIVRDLLSMPGKIVQLDDKLIQVELSTTLNQFSQDFAYCLQRLCSDP